MNLILKKIDTKCIALYGMVAAVYVVLTIILAPYSFYGVQFRIAEALTLLCFYKKEYIIPLTLGCFIANFFSPLPVPALDIIFGTAATILALLLMMKCKNIILASLMPVIVNAIIVGAELKIQNGLPFFLSALQVAIGEFVCVTVLGVIIFKVLEKNKRFMALIDV